MDWGPCACCARVVREVDRSRATATDLNAKRRPATRKWSILFLAIQQKAIDRQASHAVVDTKGGHTNCKSGESEGECDARRHHRIWRNSERTFLKRDTRKAPQ